MSIRRAWWLFCRFIAHWLAFTGYGFRTYGLTNVPVTGPLILASNHQSFFDPMLVSMALPRMTSSMARDTLFRFPPLGFLIRSFNSFPVRRGAADLGAMRESLRRLQEGWALLVFPEGTRTRDGSIGEIKGGIAVLAARARVPVIPVLIRGADKAWPRDSALPGLHPIEVRYGHPLPPEDAWDADRFGPALRAALEALARDRRPTLGTAAAWGNGGRRSG